MSWSNVWLASHRNQKSERTWLYRELRLYIMGNTGGASGTCGGYP